MLGDKKQAPAEGCRAWMVSFSAGKPFSGSMLEADFALTPALD